jgi:hypothetical protein
VATIENRGDSQLTLLTAISALGDSTPPMFITKGKTAELERLIRQQLFHDLDYVMRNAEKLS